MADFSLTPMVATTLFVAAILAGNAYRRVWKAEGPRWQLWFYGLIAGGCLIIVGMVPLDY
ncbi:MAG: hypothetical protein AAF631_13105 [Pseudomonadota bacterium]